VSRTRAQILRGSSEAPPAGLPLHAGDVHAELVGPDLRTVTLAGRELVQRVYVAIRDEGWGTVPGTLSDVQVVQDDDGFRVSFTSRHRQGALDFEWQGRYTGTADGTISCELDGVAHSAFRYAKIGFNVHHPLLESVGRRYRATGVDGPLEGLIERQIEPQRVVDGVLTAMFAPYSELAIDYGEGQAVTFAFEGDLFELQDHRNWSDGNFKSYGTPLSVPWPMDAEPGQRFHQKVVVRPVAIEGAGDAQGPTVVRVGEPSGHRLPPIGLAAASHAGSLDAHEAALVALARPRHLRVAVRLHDAGWSRALRAGLVDCARLGTDLELAVSVEAGDDAELQRLAGELTGSPVRIARVLVLERQDAFSAAAPVTSADSLARARAALGAVVGDAPFAGGSDQFFSDVNRNPPASDGLDAVCFGLCPQVHAADDTSLMENLPSLADAIATSRLICPGAGVVASPVTLAARLGPYPAGEPGPDDPPGAVDLRGLGLFGASWTLGAIAWLARESPDSVTLYETSGWRGVVERTGGAGHAAAPSTAGSAYPVLHVLADLGERRDDELVSVESSDPLAVSALALLGDDGLRVLVANHTPTGRSVRVSGLPKGGLRCRMLDERSAERAMDEPLAFASELVLEPAADGTLDVEVGPYAVLRIDG
jgi:hypothetical protein